MWNKRRSVGGVGCGLWKPSSRSPKSQRLSSRRMFCFLNLLIRISSPGLLRVYVLIPGLVCRVNGSTPVGWFLGRGWYIESWSLFIPLFLYKTSPFFVFCFFVVVEFQFNEITTLSGVVTSTGSSFSVCIFTSFERYTKSFLILVRCVILSVAQR